MLYLLDAAGQLSVNGRLVIPLLLVALGVAGLAAAVHRMARGQRSASGTASGTTAGTAADPVRAPAHVPADSRYDELSTDLEALGLLDEPDTTGETRPPRP